MEEKVKTNVVVVVVVAFGDGTADAAVVDIE